MLRRYAGALGRRRCLIGGRRRRIDADLVPRLALVLELHHPVDEGVDGVVGAKPDVVARVPFGTTLPDNDVACHDAFAAVLLDAAVLRIRIAAVARGTDAFFMCHCRPRSTEGNVVDTDFGEALAMPTLARVVLSALLLEHDDLLAAAVTQDLAGDLGPAQPGHAGPDIVAVVTEENVVEFDGAPGVPDERWDLIRAARLDT